MRPPRDFHAVADDALARPLPEDAASFLVEDWIDGHLDLAYIALGGGPNGPAPRDLTQPLHDPSVGCISYPALAEGAIRVALGTVFSECGAADQPCGYRDSTDVDGAHAAGVRQLHWYEEEERRGRIRLLRSRRDLDTLVMARNREPDAPSPLGVVLLMECADPIRTPDESAWWFERGVRVVGMSWVHGSRYAGGNGSGGGLTDAGRDLVDAFDALGILHDASHLADASLDELLERSPRRVVATHSNCRALLESKERHLSDAAIHAIAERDGVIGLNLFGRFLAVDRPATLADAVAHPLRIAEVVGAEHIALGSDADGGFPATGLPIGMQHPRSFRVLDRALADHGLSSAARAGFRSNNWLRVLRATLKD